MSKTYFIGTVSAGLNIQSHAGLLPVSIFTMPPSLFNNDLLIVINNMRNFKINFIFEDTSQIQ